MLRGVCAIVLFFVRLTWSLHAKKFPLLMPNVYPNRVSSKYYILKSRYVKGVA